MNTTSATIKMRLYEDIPVHYHDDGEPRLTPLHLRDLQHLHMDAAECVQELEDKNIELLNRINYLERIVAYYEA